MRCTLATSQGIQVTPSGRAGTAVHGRVSWGQTTLARLATGGHITKQETAGAIQ